MLVGFEVEADMDAYAFCHICQVVDIWHRSR